MFEKHAVMMKAKEQEKQKLKEEIKQLEFHCLHREETVFEQRALLSSLHAETEKLVNAHILLYTKDTLMSHLSSVQFCLMRLQTIHVFYRIYNWKAR